MDSDFLVREVRRHIAERRAAILERYRKNLPEPEYRKNIGSDEELEKFAAFFQDQVRKMNGEEAADDGD